MVAPGRSDSPWLPLRLPVWATPCFHALRRTTRYKLRRASLGARLRDRTATQRSKKGSEQVLERVLGKGSGEGFSEGFWEGGLLWVKKDPEKGSEKGSLKGFWEGGFQNVPRTPLWRVRPKACALFQKPQPLLVSKKVQQYTSILYGSTPPILYRWTFLASNWRGGKDPHPQDFSFTKKTARFTKGQFRPH